MSDRDEQTLQKVTEAWVRAEYYFRLGPNAYQTPETDWYERAIVRLRRAVTGKGDLRDAFEKLGSKEMPARGKRGRK